MDFFSNILKNTVNKAETLGKAAQAAVNSFNQNNEERKNSNDQTGSTVSEGNVNDNLSNDNNLVTDEQSTPSNTNVTDDQVVSDEKGTSFNSAEMSQKALEGAKYFGNLIFNVANKAGQTVTATAKQLKTTVENVSIMQEFTKEQQEFIKEHGGKTDLMEPPWVGCEDEEKVKVEILSLSQDKRNFVRNPPAGVEFPFEMNTSYPIALAMLREDPELSKMRYEIVPKLVNEETFWRNYFYRVSLVKQDPNFIISSGQGNRAKSWNSSKSSSSEGPDDPNEQSEPVGENEFVSDSFQNSNISAEEVRNDMYKLGIHQNNSVIDEYELDKDLEDYYVAGSNIPEKVDDDEINRELENLDLK